MKAVEGVRQAHDAWGANCGPVALAAALGLTMDEVRAAVEPFKGYMGIRDLRSAVRRGGGRIERMVHPAAEHVDVLKFGHHLNALCRLIGLPSEARALVMLRVHGPWDHNPRAAACYRHVVCYSPAIAPGHEQGPYPPGSVLDAMLLTLKGDAYWSPSRVWARRALPELLSDRATGDFAIDWIGLVG